MKQLKFYSKQLGIFLLSTIIMSLLLSILGYFNLLGNKGCHIFSIIFLLILNTILGILCGKQAETKGYLEGLKMGALIILMLLFINVIFFGSAFTIGRIIYYLLLLLVCTIGSMIGINKKTK